MDNSTRITDTQLVAAHIRSVLRWADRPLTRDELTAHVEDWARGSLGMAWQRSTVERRVRGALELLLNSDEPVISTGHGFKLAATATDAERKRAAEIRHKLGVRAFAAERRILAARLAGEAEQREMFGEVA